MVPVVQKYMTQINVVVGRCRAIDQNTSEYTIPCLDVEVGVIPARAIFNCTIGDHIGCKSSHSWPVLTLSNQYLVLPWLRSYARCLYIPTVYSRELYR